MVEKEAKDFLQDIKNLKVQVEKLKQRKKYGLVWDAEKEPEKVVLDCRKKLPILVEDKSKEIKGKDDEPVNLLIEGDNYHSLSVLNYTHKGKIDVIYIDPPYNTKNEGFIYNDHKVDINDSYRHSKWLNFIEKRLKLAKNLLSNYGVIFISIDDNEQAQLKLLCDQIFGENAFVSQFIAVTAPAGTQSSTDVAQQHAYCLMFKKTNNFKTRRGELDKKRLQEKYPEKDEIGNFSTERLWKRGIGGRKEDVPSLHFPVYYDPTTNKIYIDDEVTKKNNLIKIIPYQTKGVLGRWTWSKKKMINEKEKLIVKKVAGEYVLHKKKYYFEDEGCLPMTLINQNIARTELGSLELKEILGGKYFDYPKYSGFIEYFLKFATKKDSTILDFFAGSGTTGQAVLNLNKNDKGKRKFILCTNNENEICNKITFPRMYNVMKGYSFKGKDINLLYEKKITLIDLKKNTSNFIKELEKIQEEKKSNYNLFKREFKNNTLRLFGIRKIVDKKEGLGGNLRYYKTDFVETENLDNATDQDKIELTYKAGEMIAIREDTFEEVEKNDWWQIFSNGKKATAIYFKEDKSKLQKLVDKLDKMNKKVNLYIFSWGKNEYTNEFPEYKNIKVKDIPEPLIEVYKEVANL